MNKQPIYQIHLSNNVYLRSGCSDYEENFCMSDFNIYFIKEHAPNFLTGHFKITICVFQDDFTEKVLSETEFDSYEKLAVYLTKMEMAAKAFEIIGLKVISEECNKEE